MRVLAATVALVELLLSLGVFALVARPEAFLGVFALLLGEREAWLSGRMDEAGRARLVSIAERARGPVIILLFAWSFLTGALLLLSRL